jgi:hypothetical protein
MAFEIFQSTGVRNKAFISITENKTFGLSRAFVVKNGITNDHKAIILYDKEANKIALHFRTDNPKYGLKVRIASESHGGLIVARSFFDLKDVDPSQYKKRYDDFETTTLRDLGINTEGKAFVITLLPKDESVDPPLAESEEQIIVEDISDEPINLDDIPF